MSKYYEECNICNTLCDYRKNNFVKFKCPTYLALPVAVLTLKTIFYFWTILMAA